jgi:hypothetical protein
MMWIGDGVASQRRMDRMLVMLMYVWYVWYVCTGVYKMRIVVGSIYLCMVCCR